MANFAFQYFVVSLFYQHNINSDSKLAVWQIEEPEAYFSAKARLTQDVTHPHKRLQHLAGRYLLAFLFPDFPMEEILIAGTRKPFLEKEQYHFSISHCGHFAAAILSRTHQVGVDVEMITPRILSIGHKFLSPPEYELAVERGGIKENLTLIWSAKEAIFKWYGKGELDFKKHIRLVEVFREEQEGWTGLSFEFQKEEPRLLAVKARVFDQLTLAWILT
jgi:phosphopantetheinyl transferase